MTYADHDSDNDTKAVRDRWEKKKLNRRRERMQRSETTRGRARRVKGGRK